MDKLPFVTKRTNVKGVAGGLKATVNLGVCSGRHEMPVDNFVFDKIEDPTDVYALEEKASKWYRENVAPLKEEGYSVDINIYVTGLTVAMMAIVKVFLHGHEWAIDDDYPCIVHNGDITLWHFDALGKGYYPQELFNGATRGE